MIDCQVKGPPKPLAVQGPRVQWFKPATLQQLLALRDRYPHTNDRGKQQNRILVGNTEIGKCGSGIYIYSLPNTVAYQSCVSQSHPFIYKY